MPSSTHRAGAPGRIRLFIRLFLALGLAIVAAPLLLASSTSAAPNDKVVVCKYVSTPGGVLDHIVIVDESTLGNPQQPWPGTLPFIWSDAQGQTSVGSIAIRYANPGEQAHDVDPAECPQEPVDACPDLPGDQPEGFQCDPLTETETQDVGPILDCDAGTVTTLHQERTRTQEFVDGAWVWGDWSEWVTVDTTVVDATEEECPDDPIDPIDPPNPPNPPAPPTDPTLPQTGGEAYLGGLALLSGLVLAAGAAMFRRSRRIGVTA